MEPGVHYGFDRRTPWLRHVHRQREAPPKQLLGLHDPITPEELEAYRTLEGESLIFRLVQLQLVTREQLRQMFKQKQQYVRTHNKPLRKKVDRERRLPRPEFYAFVGQLHRERYLPAIEAFMRGGHASPRAAMEALLGEK
ncbi:MAG: hypothetical protein G01um101425_145 [Candidatus Peregrinibacteria bacterium Gr01-1014_25]|nr:MAG: hypothetical protein G01um101425_145 [Candidatus Peregrinibacteria bacterium Gr01-1014_25]